MRWLGETGLSSGKVNREKARIWREIGGIKQKKLAPSTDMLFQNIMIFLNHSSHYSSFVLQNIIAISNYRITSGFDWLDCNTYILYQFA